MTRIFLMAALALPLGAVAAAAQSDPTQMAHMSASNELGVLEYCQSNGWTDQAAVDAQKKSIAALPASTNTSGLAGAEATGKQGTFDINGNQTTLAQMANTKNTSQKAICGQLGTSVKNAAASMSSMPNMPAMPGGMPAMPNGMPSMPNNMPSMPAAPGGTGTSQ